MFHYMYNMYFCKFDHVFTKNLTIPVWNQKLHPEHLTGCFQNTEEKEQFLTKNWRFSPKTSFFCALRYFYLNVLKYWLTIGPTHIAIPAKKWRKASKSSKTWILGSKWPFFSTQNKNLASSKYRDLKFVIFYFLTAFLVPISNHKIFTFSPFFQS